jgi:hypothetical protein
MLSCTVVASAGTIVGAVALQTDMGALVPSQTAIDHIADQSGLSVGYSSGGEDFATYLGGSPAHASLLGTDWISQSGSTTGFIEFDLGAVMVVDAMAIWNMAFQNSEQLSAAVTAFDLFANGRQLGSYTLGVPTGNPSIAEVIGFSPVVARFIRMEITANNGSLVSSALGEVAFSAFPIPEPGAALLFGAGWLIVTGSVRSFRRY